MVINYISCQQLRPSSDTHILDDTSTASLVSHCMTTVHTHTTAWEGFTVENFMIQPLMMLWIRTCVHLNQYVHGVPHDYHSTPLPCNWTRYVHITIATLQGTGTLAEVVFTASRSDKLSYHRCMQTTPKRPFTCHSQYNLSMYA